jgi:hypothetical protein
MKDTRFNNINLLRYHSRSMASQGIEVFYDEKVYSEVRVVEHSIFNLRYRLLLKELRDACKNEHS